MRHGEVAARREARARGSGSGQGLREERLEGDAALVRRCRARRCRGHGTAASALRPGEDSARPSAVDDDARLGRRPAAPLERSRSSTSQPGVQTPVPERSNWRRWREAEGIDPVPSLGQPATAQRSTRVRRPSGSGQEELASGPTRPRASSSPISEVIRPIRQSSSLGADRRGRRLRR